jgi:hypothetical protein
LIQWQEGPEGLGHLCCNSIWCVPECGMGWHAVVRTNERSALCHLCHQYTADLSCIYTMSSLRSPSTKRFVTHVTGPVSVAAAEGPVLAARP